MAAAAREHPMPQIGDTQACPSGCGCQVPVTVRDQTAVSARRIVAELRTNAEGADSARLDLLDQLLARGGDDVAIREAWLRVCAAGMHLGHLVRAGVVSEDNPACAAVDAAAAALFPLVEGR
jgi:hypothetical protein